ncbi:MAG: BT_2262 family domain-containing protein [Prevotella sp.]
MKKSILYTIASLFAVVMLTACSDAEEGLVRVTHYATFELNGADANNVTTVAVGTPYTDPGCVCMEGDNDITASVVTSGTVDANTLGVYHVTYSAKNVDGFESSITRTVVVYDPTAIDRNIGGTYTTKSGSYRYWLSSGAKVAFADYNIDVEYVAPGLYHISDYMGGYYDQRAGYGSDYAMKGYFALNNDNTITALTADVAGWGDSADEVTAAYDEATGEINLEVAYAGSMIFYITLTK